ncbi:MAG TPA: hypothetical protein VJ227_01875 [Patescibacteria group bacterium]|nr:hypothetical protein [Patescibacteria group bacterium]
MKERFVNIGKRIGERIDNFLKVVLDIPPSFQEAAESFRHKKGCSASEPPRKVVNTQFVNLGDGGVWGGNITNTLVEITLLECPECHSSVRYSDH